MEYEKTAEISKNSQQNNSETVSNENYKEIHKKDISPEERQNIIDNMIFNIIV